MAMSTNTATTVAEELPCEECCQLLKADPPAVLLDCRPPMFLQRCRAKNSLHVPFRPLRSISALTSDDAHRAIQQVLSDLEQAEHNTSDEKEESDSSPGAGAATVFKARQGRVFVVMDSGATLLSQNSPAGQLVKVLAAEGRVARAVLLQGGFTALQKTMPQELIHAQTDVPTIDVASMRRATSAEVKPTVIIPGQLYVGHKKDASNFDLLQSLGVTHILNVSCDIPLFFPDILVCARHAIEDDGTDSLLEKADSAFRFLRVATDPASKNCCLIHCYLGRSRSVALATAFAMTEGLTPPVGDAAPSQSAVAGGTSSMQSWLRYMSQHRSIALNRRFLQELQQLDQSLRTKPASQ